MAANDVIFFDDAWERIGEAINLETDIFKIGLIKSAANGGADPSASDVGPAWSGGTTNYLLSEVTPGGNYLTGGNECQNSSYTQLSGATKWDTDDPGIWNTDPSNPTNARWGILYDDTTTPKYALAFIDLGADKDMTSIPIQLVVNPLGWYSGLTV